MLRGMNREIRETREKKCEMQRIASATARIASEPPLNARPGKAGESGIPIRIS